MSQIKFYTKYYIGRNPLMELKIFIPPFRGLKVLVIINLVRLLFHRILPQSTLIVFVQFKGLVIVSWDLYSVFLLIDLYIGLRKKYSGHYNEFLRILSESSGPFPAWGIQKYAFFSIF